MGVIVTLIKEEDLEISLEIRCELKMNRGRSFEQSL
jgi:hypothetical protein